MPLVFEWDSRKAKGNQLKHKVSFDEASTVFEDAGATIFPDEDHSNGEEREIIIGYSVLDRVLLVIFIESPADRIRIISARKATRREREDYEEDIRS